MNIKEKVQRWWHRSGFGIHSPWAYELVTEALFSEDHYYAFDTMEGTEADRQLYRLFLWLKPKHYTACGGTESAKAHMKAAFQSTGNKTEAEILYFAPDRLWEVEKAFGSNWWSVGQNTCIIVDGICQKEVAKPNVLRPETLVPRAVWDELLQKPQTTSAFDLGDRGIVFFDPARQRQTYLL